MTATALAILAALAAGSAPPGATPGHRAVGVAKHYSPGVFAAVARRRGLPLRSDVAGYASVPDCRWVGRVILVSLAGSAFERYQVLDCSDPTPRRQPGGRFESDRARHLREGLVVEVDYASARRHQPLLRDGRAPAAVRYP